MPTAAVAGMSPRTSKRRWSCGYLFAIAMYTYFTSNWVYTAIVLHIDLRHKNQIYNLKPPLRMSFDKYTGTCETLNPVILRKNAYAMHLTLLDQYKTNIAKNHHKSFNYKKLHRSRCIRLTSFTMVHRLRCHKQTHTHRQTNRYRFQTNSPSFCVKGCKNKIINLYS